MAFSIASRSVAAGLRPALRAPWCAAEFAPLCTSAATPLAKPSAPSLPTELYNPPAVASHVVSSAAGAPAEHVDRKFAVVAVGASQYKVTPGDVLIVDKVKDAEVGKAYTFDNVLLVGSQTETVVGRPRIATAKVVADVEQQTHAKRIRIFKNRKRSTFKRTKGYRRQITVFRIKDVAF